jgi:hypothetical protein
MMFSFSSEARMNELVAKANKPLAKLGLPQLVVTSVTPRKFKDLAPDGKEFTRVVFDAEIEVPQVLVQIAGVQVVARLENIEGLNMITRIGEYEGNLDAYREATIECQHCNLQRNRKGSWVVLNPEGQQIQVGDTCVDLYFGVNVERILRTSYQIHSILNSDDFGGCPREYEHTARFIALCAWTASTRGFVTKKQADEQVSTSTSQEARWLCGPLHSNDPREREDYNAKNAQADQWLKENYEGQSVSQLVLDFWMEREELSEFEHNCRVAILSQNLRYQGLVAYATKLWVDAIHKTTQATPPPSQHVGQVGDKLSFTGTIKNIYRFSTQWGTTTQIIFMDPQGNIFVWKATNNPGVNVGETVKVRGTVKAHNDYKGTLQTLLTHCVID